MLPAALPTKLDFQQYRVNRRHKSDQDALPWKSLPAYSLILSRNKLHHNHIRNEKVELEKPPSMLLKQELDTRFEHIEQAFFECLQRPVDRILWWENSKAKIKQIIVCSYTGISNNEQ